MSTVTINEKIATLESQLQEAEQRKNDLAHDPRAHAHALNEYNNLSASLGEMRAELANIEAQEQEHEQRVNEATNEFDAVLETVDFGGLTLRQIVGSEDDYQLVSIGLKQVFRAQAERYSAQIKEQQQYCNEQMKASADREEQLKVQNEALKAEKQQMSEELDEYKNFELEATLAKQARDNAAQMLEEAKVEIERYKAWNDDLRQQIAFGGGAYKVIDTEEEERKKQDLAEKLKRERTIYNKQWVDPIRRDKFRAQYAINGETFEFPWTQEKKYFEISAEEVPSFRSQFQIDNPVETVPTVGEESVPVNTTEVTFPTIQTAVGLQLAQDTSGVQGEGLETTAGEVTREEFETLKQRVSALERTSTYVA